MMMSTLYNHILLQVDRFSGADEGKLRQKLNTLK